MGQKGPPMGWLEVLELLQGFGNLLSARGLGLLAGTSRKELQCLNKILQRCCYPVL